MQKFRQITGFNWIKEPPERQVSDGSQNGAGIWNQAYVCRVYAFISTQTGCVLTDSTLTQVEGDSRMKSKVGRQKKGDRNQSDGMNNWWYKLLQNSNQKSENWRNGETKLQLLWY